MGAAISVTAVLDSDRGTRMTATEHTRASQTPDPLQGLVRAAPHATGPKAAEPHSDGQSACYWASTPSSARITDYLLGGRHNYPADRQVADRVSAAAPWFETAVLINRVHGHLTVAALAQEHGITQFLDLGCGLLPTGNGYAGPHEPVCSSAPGATFVHVDADNTMAGRTRTCLSASPRSHPFVHADFRNIFSVLRAPAVQCLDPGKPVGVLVHDALAWTSKAEARFTLDQVRVWAPLGSAISISHFTADFQTHEAIAAAQILSEAGLPFQPRTRNEIAELLAPWALQEPGVVPISRYHEGNGFTHLPDHVSGAYAAIVLYPSGRGRHYRPPDRSSLRT
ncbi:SAM-dependent methyltransferase [Streptomyces sp. NPDC002540]